MFDLEFQKQSDERLRQAGITLGKFESDLIAYQAVVDIEKPDWLSGQDYILFIELDEIGSGHHDESMAVMGVDYICTGSPGTNFDGSSIISGISVICCPGQHITG